MSLIKCKECGSEISNKAKSCPQCGAPQKLPPSWGFIIFLSFLAAIVAFIIVPISPREGSVINGSANVDAYTLRNIVPDKFKAQGELCRKGVDIWASPLTRDFKSLRVWHELKDENLHILVDYVFTGLNLKRISGIGECEFSKKGENYTEKAISVFLYSNNAGEYLKQKDLRCFNAGYLC